MTKLKVLFVDTLLPKYVNPIYERISQLSGIELIVLADLVTKHQLNQYEKGHDQFDAVHVSSVSFGSVTLRPGLFKLIRMVNPDIVIVDLDPRDLSELGVLFWCRFKGIPVGVWSMFYKVGPRRLFFEAYMGIIGRLANISLSYSERGRSEQISRGVPKNRIVVLGTAIDEHTVLDARDQLTAQELASFQAAQNISDKMVLLHVARLTKNRRADLTLKCLAKIVSRRKDVVLVFIGGGPFESDIKTLASDLELSDHVRFVEPIYDEADLALWFCSAAIFVMATSVGLSMQHAMCYSLPLVTDDNLFTQGPEFEALVDNETGLIYKAENVDDYAAKVERLIDDPELRTSLGANALARVKTEYSIDRKVNNFNIAFRQLAAEMPSVGPSTSSKSSRS